MRIGRVLLLALLTVSLAPTALADDQGPCAVVVAHCPWGGIDGYGVSCGPVQTPVTRPICFW